METDVLKRMANAALQMERDTEIRRLTRTLAVKAKLDPDNHPKRCTGDDALDLQLHVKLNRLRNEERTRMRVCEQQEAIEYVTYRADMDAFRLRSEEEDKAAAHAARAERTPSNAQTVN